MRKDTPQFLVARKLWRNFSIRTMGLIIIYDMILQQTISFYFKSEAKLFFQAFADIKRSVTWLTNTNLLPPHTAQVFLQALSLK